MVLQSQQSPFPAKRNIPWPANSIAFAQTLPYNSIEGIAEFSKLFIQQTTPIP